MLTLKNTTAERIAALAAELFSVDTLSATDVLAMLEYPPDPAMGDLALPCFRLSKVLRRSPMDIAARLADSLSGEV